MQIIGIRRTFVLTSLLAQSLVSSAAAQSHLMRYADVHQDTIVFTYEGDLWLVGTSGGDARRITRDAGNEEWAKFSPDGKLLAFTAQYDGGTDVYVMEAAGGPPRRLTFHPAADRVLGWFPDGQYVLFRSNREYPTRSDEIYKIALTGGMPERVAVDRGGLADVSPDGRFLAYNPISTEQRTWKRYQGGMAPDVWLADFQTGEFTQLTDWVGTDSFPMWAGQALYFTSDREKGTLNIYRLNVQSKAVEALTTYSDYDVKYPSAGPGAIVYQYAESLHLLDLQTGKTRAVPVRIPSDRIRVRPEMVEVAPTKGSFALSPTGKRLLLAARGEILNLPVEEGEPLNLTRAPASREKNAAWSPDGRWVAFISDQTGEEELYLVDQKAEKPWRQLTSAGGGFRMHLVWSPDSKYLLFSDKVMRLNLVDAESGTLTEIDRADYDDAWERWGIQDYVWSPDSRWIAYTKMEQSMNDSIFLYSLDQQQVQRVTPDTATSFSPSFDPQGRYLYFLSNRTFEPIMGFVDQSFVFLSMCRPYAVILKADAPSPFAPGETHEEVQPATDETAPVVDAPNSKPAADQAQAAAPTPTPAEEKAETSTDAKPANGKTPSATVIDLDGLAQRVVAVENVPAGNYFRLEATAKGFVYLQRNEHQFEKYQAVTDETGGELDLYYYEVDKPADKPTHKRETKKVLSGIANYHLSADGKKLVYRAGARYGVADVGKEAKVGDGEVKLGGVRVTVDRQLEFLQIFNEAWRVQRDWFYDPGMHGVDWSGVGAMYRRFVPDCGNRSDLSYLIGEMISELNSGHTYVMGGDGDGGARNLATGLLGCEFAARPGADYFAIARIIPGTPGDERERSPLAEPGCPIRPGHYLIAIDGAPVRTTDNVYAFLQNKADKVVTLTFNDQPTPEGARTQRVRTLGSEQAIRYREWVETNRAFVEEAGGGQIGYLHIPDMGGPGLVEFSRSWFPHYYKKAFVIDERYNGGGFTADMIIDILERRQWALTKPREGRPFPDPERCFNGHLIVLINEETGSSGEMFAEAIKRKQLAPLLGMRTWGGSVGIEAHQDLVDGGVTTPPQFGLYGLDRTWPIEGHGVDPDIKVANYPGDVLRGQDAQLTAAVKHLLDKLAKDPREQPAPPPYPDKSKKAGAK